MLYKLFLSNDSKTHVVLTDAVTQFMDMSMSYDDGHDLRFGFAWVGVGTFITRTDALSFLRDVHKIPKQYSKHSDIFFTIFTNKIPLTISALITPLSGNNSPEKLSAASNYEDFLQLARKAAFEAVLRAEPHFSSSAYQAPVGEKCAAFKAVCPRHDYFVLDNSCGIQTNAALHSRTPDQFTKVSTDLQERASKYPFYAICDFEGQSRYEPLGKLHSGRYIGYLFAHVTELVALETQISVLSPFKIEPTHFALDIRDSRGSWSPAPVAAQFFYELDDDERIKSRLFYVLSPTRTTGIRLRLRVNMQTASKLAIHEILPFSEQKARMARNPLMKSRQESIMCESDDFLVVVVTTTTNGSNGGRNVRDIIRQTLGKQVHGLPVRILFAVARPKDASSIFKELEEFNDIVQLDIEDSYDGLSAKTFEVLRWVSSSCVRARYFMKIDDDSYVQFGILIDELISHNNKEYLYMGHFFFNQEVYHDPAEKNFEPYYDGNRYPPYASGSGYILSMPLVNHLVNSEYTHGPNMRLIRNEDALLGLWLAGLNISTVHSDLFFPEPPAFCRPDAILLHRQRTQDFISYHRNYLQRGTICG